MRCIIIIALTVSLALAVACSKKEQTPAKQPSMGPAGNTAVDKTQVVPDTRVPPAGTKTADKPQTTCPVMGNPIDKTLFADYNGKRVYFCCPGCIDTFNADPEKYIKILEDAGVKLEEIPKE
jgi:YHS domain-containing protein